jgi:hypothetical protein
MEGWGGSDTEWALWLSMYFHRALASEFADFHRAFWRWLWSVGFDKPDDSFVAVWPRGAGKSSAAELALVALGARRRRKYGIYVCATQDQADDHVGNVAAWLESAQLAEHYPAMCNRALTKFGQVKAWRRNRLRCKNGFTLDSLGLDTASRGLKIDEMRPDVIWFDDIDSETDSPQMIEKKIRIMTRRILPTGAPNVCIASFQNLVHADSIQSRLVDGRADFMIDRFVSGPFPALKNMVVETEGIRSVIVSGEPTWPAGMDIERCQDLMDDIGLQAFLVECQHQVKDRYRGAILPEFNETYHVITWSEFVRYFGKDACGCAFPHDLNMPCPNPRVPFSWALGRGQDWGTTRQHPCATVWVGRPHERDRLNDSVFVYRELVRPSFPPKKEAELVNPRRMAEEIHGLEHRWEEGGRMQISILSHEASATHNTYLDPDLADEHRLGFMKHQPMPQAGIPQLQNYLQINFDEPHPFRHHPEDDSQVLQGRPRLYFVVADGEGELYHRDDKLLVRPATSAAGLARLRWEIPQYRYKELEDGRERSGIPFKMHDDAVDALRYVANVFFPRRPMKSALERQEEQLPEAYRRDMLNRLGPEALERYLLPREEALKALKEQKHHFLQGVFDSGSKNIT